MRRIRDRLTYANVISTIALFLVLTGGTTVALSGSNTVFSDDIVNNDVYSADVRDDTLSSGGLGAVDLRPNSVGGSEVQNGSLTPVDFKNVVARARGSSSVSTGDGGPVSYPLSNNTWTQGANETDFVVGQLSFDPPATCTGGGGDALVRLDGKVVLSASVGVGTGEPRTMDLVGSLGGGSADLFEPGSPDPRTLTAEISDFCSNPGENFTITSIKLNVIGFR